VAYNRLFARAAEGGELIGRRLSPVRARKLPLWRRNGPDRQVQQELPLRVETGQLIVFRPRAICVEAIPCVKRNIVLYISIDRIRPAPGWRAAEVRKVDAGASRDATCDANGEASQIFLLVSLVTL
jgi:hypothetical protein